MISELDIYRSAPVLVNQHGEDAPIHAAMRADAMLEAGDLDGYAVWKRILRAVEELQGAVPAAGGACSLSSRLAPLRRAALPPTTPRARSWTCECGFR